MAPFDRSDKDETVKENSRTKHSKILSWSTQIN